MQKDSIYIVSSYTNTVPGKLITIRAAMKFWNRYLGDTYSHISLSKDSLLNDMITFARKEINNPFNSGIVKEDIRKGLFAKNKEKSRIAVMKLELSKEQYNLLCKNIDAYWADRDNLQYNYAGLITMLFCSKGVAIKNHYFCSQWVATIIQEIGIDLFDGKKPCDIRPFDFYCKLKDAIIYKGLTVNYPQYDIGNSDIEIKEEG